MTEGLVLGSQNIRALWKQFCVEGGDRRHACTIKKIIKGQEKKCVHMLVMTDNDPEREFGCVSMRHDALSLMHGL